MLSSHLYCLCLTKKQRTLTRLLAPNAKISLHALFTHSLVISLPSLPLSRTCALTLHWLPPLIPSLDPTPTWCSQPLSPGSLTHQHSGITPHTWRHRAAARLLAVFTRFADFWRDIKVFSETCSSSSQLLVVVCNRKERLSFKI